MVLIGEIRDHETMEHALALADIGHLVISTLHAHNANQALDRIINISSGLTRFSLPGYGAYAAMKGAMEVLTRGNVLSRSYAVTPAICRAQRLPAREPNSPRDA